MQRRTVATVVGTVALTGICGAAAIAVNLSILHRTPPDPIGKACPVLQVGPANAVPSRCR